MEAGPSHFLPCGQRESQICTIRRVCETEKTRLLSPEHFRLELRRAERDAELERNLPVLDAAGSVARNEVALEKREVGSDGANLAERGEEVACGFEGEWEGRKGEGEVKEWEEEERNPSASVKKKQQAQSNSPYASRHQEGVVSAPSKANSSISKDWRAEGSVMRRVYPIVVRWLTSTTVSCEKQKKCEGEGSVERQLQLDSDLGDSPWRGRCSSHHALL
jgi:hypothetical protein